MSEPIKIMVCPWCKGKGFKVVELDYIDCTACEASGVLLLYAPGQDPRDAKYDDDTYLNQIKQDTGD